MSYMSIRAYVLYVKAGKRIESHRMTELNWVTHQKRNGLLERQSAPLNENDLAVVAKCFGITAEAVIDTAQHVECPCYHRTNVIDHNLGAKEEAADWPEDKWPSSDEEWAAYYRRLGIGE